MTSPDPTPATALDRFALPRAVLAFDRLLRLLVLIVSLILIYFIVPPPEPWGPR